MGKHLHIQKCGYRIIQGHVKYPGCVLQSNPHHHSIQHVHTSYASDYVRGIVLKYELTAVDCMVVDSTVLSGTNLVN